MRDVCKDPMYEQLQPLRPWILNRPMLGGAGASGRVCRMYIGSYYCRCSFYSQHLNMVRKLQSCWQSSTQWEEWSLCWRESLDMLVAIVSERMPSKWIEVEGMAMV